MSMVNSGIIKRSSCKSDAVSRVSVGQHKLVRSRGNCEVSEIAGIADQGQVSKLLARLERLQLVANTGAGHQQGKPNAWVLTDKGEQAVQRMHLPPTDQRRAA
jgi:hypothetical protein